MNWLTIDRLLIDALKEDMPAEDITTISLVSPYSMSTVNLIAKENGVLAGIKVFQRVFTLLGGVDVNLLKEDGQEIKSGTVVAHLKGNTRNLLSGERVALNFLQRMCGIATLTREYVTALNGTTTRLLDTRKTTPNMRLLDKYAVTMGGGCNHRINLSDGVLIKDNHIAAAGGVTEAVNRVRKSISFVRKIEVEVETIEMVKEALEVGADIIMLDNMSLNTMAEAVKLINNRALTEASGNITLDNIRNVAETGVDFISVGALTHSYKAFDLSMKDLRNV